MFSRYLSREKIIELIVVAIVQIFFVVGVTVYVHYKISNVQNKLNIELREKQKMEETTSQFNTLAHGRLFLMNRLISYYKSPSDVKDKEKFRNEYIDSVVAWNANRGNLESNIKLYFGDESLLAYQEKIDKPFRDIHQKVYTSIKNNKDDKNLAEILKSGTTNLDSQIIELTQSIYDLDKKMQEIISSVVKQD